MDKNKISRKDFFYKALSGIAGLSLLSKKTLASGNAEINLRNVGSTGIMVSPICFGAPRTNDESLIRYAIDKGLNFIDTGRAYGNGKNESLVGKSISGIRDKVVIQSKIRLEYAELKSAGKGRKGSVEIHDTLSKKLEESLEALNTSYIDILLYHDAQEENLLFHPEVLKFFADKKSEGVIKASGFSTHNDHMNLPERNNSHKYYDIIMVPFNPKGSFTHSVTGDYSEWNQEKQLSILSEAGSKGIGIIAMKTCSCGKYSLTPQTEPSFTDSVRWVLQHRFISSAAIAMANFEQVDEHLSGLKK